jgi:hypothetical protein
MSKIDRHNYEEYFIQYMDNELSSEDRRQVEAFVQKHPDLKEELDILLQYKLEPDTSITYKNKEELLKLNGESFITDSNYEEWLVLYIDNELSADQQKSVEDFIALHPEAKKKLAQLQRVKLQPEVIAFPHKESLYRKEEKVRRITITWWRVAAAVLLFTIGTGAYFILNNRKNTDKDDVAINPGIEKIVSPEQTPIVPLQQNNQTVATTDEINPEKDNNSTTSNNVVADKNNTAVQAPVYKQTVIPAIANNNKKNVVAPQDKQINITPVQQQPKDNQPALVSNNDKPSNNLPQPLNNPNVSSQKDDAVAVNNTPENKIQKDLTIPPVTNDNTSSSGIIQASYDPVEQPSEKKGKFRGFFRKITRTFEKRTNIDPTDGSKEKRVLIAGLSFKTK